MNTQQGISNVELIYFPSSFLVRYWIFFFVTLAHFRHFSLFDIRIWVLDYSFLAYPHPVNSFRGHRQHSASAWSCNQNLTSIRRQQLQPRPCQFPGRHRISVDIEQLICKMARENTWGYEKIQAQIF